MFKILPFGLIVLSTAAGTLSVDTIVSQDIIDRCNVYAEEFRCQHEQLVPGAPAAVIATSPVIRAGPVVHQIIANESDLDAPIHPRLAGAGMTVQASILAIKKACCPERRVHSI
jgi:hypothetical protein